VTRHQHEDDDEDDEVDPEGPDPSEMDASDEPDLDVCPHCRKLISEEAERCPHCGEYLTPGSAPMPWWMWVALGLVIISFLALLLRG
jgi:hypothetical protein